MRSYRLHIFFLFVGDSIYTTRSYSLSIDGTIVMEDLHLFERSLSSLFSAYYVFNVAYPEEICATLEFIQRCFVGVNPDRGNRREKKRKTCVHKKVLKLIADMAEFEWSCK